MNLFFKAIKPIFLSGGVPSRVGRVVAYSADSLLQTNQYA